METSPVLTPSISIAVRWSIDCFEGNILNVITADEEQLADGLGIILPATDILENEKSCEHECSCAVGYVVAESLKLLAKLEEEGTYMP